MQATLNIRLDKLLKERGEKVLKDNGISVSDAVRGLWEEMATTRSVPSFLVSSDYAEVTKNKKRQALADLQNLFTKNCGKKSGALLEMQDAPYEKLRNDMYEEKLQEYLALK